MQCDLPDCLSSKRCGVLQTRTQPLNRTLAGSFPDASFNPKCLSVRGDAARDLNAGVLTAVALSMLPLVSINLTFASEPLSRPASGYGHSVRLATHLRV